MTLDNNSTRVGRILQGLSTLNKWGVLEQTAVGCAAFIFLSLALLFVLDSCAKKRRNQEQLKQDAAHAAGLERQNTL
ncbi:Hypp6286 [Branchiostoma lanceolatum]|uniref:Hypp6286 protein n=1 Tax=Branchiostoma lanceolatum TaxID=7740 RepID=A0A8J9YQ74_BRALA|nr:Hypp6286 [Branchiostoma lanceolatum]